jgi:hypothetical protein
VTPVLLGYSREPQKNIFDGRAGTVLVIHFEKEIDQFSIKYGKYIRLKDAESE